MKHPEIRGLRDWRPLARGGLAVVWQARQQPLDRLVAVKVYEPEFDAGYRSWFLREAAAAGRLSGHRGVVSVHDVGMLPDGRPYLIMELCPGGSLTSWLKPENRPGEERVQQVGARIADTLAAVHARGVVHGDVNPANILIDRFDNPRLAGFGVATVSGAEIPAASVLHTTPAYAPPEAFWVQRTTEAGDVFSLGATLYALLEGRPPRGVRALPVSLEQMLEFAFIPIGRIPGVRWEVMGALMAALSNDPTARPTAAAFGEQLARPAAIRIPVRQPHFTVAVPTTSKPLSLSGAPVRAAISTDHGGALTAAAAGSRPSPGLGPVEGRREKRRRNGVLALAAAALVTAVASTTAWLVSVPATQSAIPGGRSTTASTARPADPRPPVQDATAADGDRAGSGSPDQKTIRLASMGESAKPWQTVAIQGTYVGGAETLLHVQQWKAGKWRAFPIPAKTDKSGRFSAYVELGQPSRYRLRVLDPDAGAKSKPFTLEIRG